MQTDYGNVELDGIRRDWRIQDQSAEMVRQAPETLPLEEESDALSGMDLWNHAAADPGKVGTALFQPFS